MGQEREGRSLAPEASWGRGNLLRRGGPGKPSPLGCPGGLGLCSWVAQPTLFSFQPCSFTGCVELPQLCQAPRAHKPNSGAHMCGLRWQARPWERASGLGTGRKQRTAFTSSGRGMKGGGNARLHCEAGEGSCHEDTQRRGAYVL